MPRDDRVTDLLLTLESLGGTAPGRELIEATSRAAVRKAVANGLIRREGRGRYARVSERAAVERDWARWTTEEPSADWLAARRADLARARAFRACLSHRSAALAWDWPVLVMPATVEMTVDRNRRSAPIEALGKRKLTPAELEDGITSPLGTVLDCARTLPLVEAVAVADGALRSGLVGPTELAEAADRRRGADARAVRRVTGLADGRAANPFESAVRTVASDVEGLQLEPQADLSGDGLVATVDLADRALGLVVEADSYAYHGSKEAFDDDIDRYDELAVRGWMVVRARWDHVGAGAGRFRDLLRAGVLTLRARKASAREPCPRCPTADLRASGRPCLPATDTDAFRA